MSSDWDELTIDDLKAPTKNAIAMGPFGSRIRASNFVTKGIPVIKGGNLNGDFISEDNFDYLTEEKATELQSSNAYRRDIVITHRGTIGQVGIIPDDSRFERYVVSQSQLKVTLDQDKVNPFYVYYFLRSPLGQHRLLVNSSQVGVPAIAQASTSVKGILVPFPKRKTQDSIVEILMDLDKKIATNTQTNQTLEQIAQAIFKSWFVDFEPVRAKMAVLEAGGTAEQAELAAMSAISGKTEEQLLQLKAEQPEADAHNCMDAGGRATQGAVAEGSANVAGGRMPGATYAELAQTAALFPAAMVDSKLGEIPEGWNTLPLDKIAHYQNGLALQKFRPKNENEFLPVVKIAQLKKGFADGEEKASPDIKPECIIDDGDVVFSWSGSLVVDIWCGGKAALNQHLFKVTSETYPKWFYHYFTKHHLAEFQRIAADKAVTMGHIKREHLASAKCAIPTDEIVSKGSELIGSLLEKQIEQRLETNTLTETRDALLPKLLSGDLPITNTEVA